VDIARQIAKYEDKGFSRDRAEVNTLMEHAAVTIFKDFPDAFVLFGGATLVLYHDSVRHSADLDLLSRTAGFPSPEEISASLQRDLTPVGQIMELGELRFQLERSNSREGRIFVSTSAGRRLFRIDLTRLGSAIESEIEDHPIEGESGLSAVIKSATKELLLFQKAEAFLMRRSVKARDAYDINLLNEIGAVLSPNLRAHLQDTILGNEIDSETISDRIDRVGVDLCRLELKPILPANIYSELEEAQFEPLRNALRYLYKEWL
jgi:hypothetical protein